MRSAAYGLAVWLGSAGLGFGVAPWLGTATGLFAIDVESQSFFSLLTLAGMPYLAGLAVVSAQLYPRIARRRVRFRLAAYALHVAVVWLIGASIALLRLG